MAATGRSLPSVLASAQARLLPQVEERLLASLEAKRSALPPRLFEAMGHCLMAGGKRLRPLLVLECAGALGGEAARERAFPAALAVEYLHTYSLVHDDLPALDNDDLRRGRPTVHRAFDEATAILVGDALLTDAFDLVATDRVRGGEMARELARAAGSTGMVAGQYVDLTSENLDRSLEELAWIHERKTGRLFSASAALGGLAGGADDELLARLRAYGDRLGLAFQIADDVLDVEGDPEARGKRRGGDEERGKATYVRLLGLDGAKARAAEAAADAAAQLSGLGPEGDVLRALSAFAAQRSV